MSTRKVQHAQSMRGGRERGVALILVMLSMLVLSVLAATIVFTARSETFASYNFKLDTQADYLAKAGIQQAINWFRSNHYQPLTQSNANTYYAVTSTGSPYNLWTSNTSAVTCISGCSTNNSGVQLIGYGSGSSNYPDIDNTEATPRRVTTAFASDLNSSANTRVSGDANNSGFFNINAILLNYQTVNVGQVVPYTPTPVETWLITSKATWTGGSGLTATIATAEEQAIVQPIYNPTWGFAMYGFCSVTMSGSAGTCTDAFNSALGAYGGGSNSTAAAGCDSASNNVIAAGAGVGSNGGVTLVGGNATVGGNVTIADTPTPPCSTAGFTGNVSQVLGEVVNGPHKPPPPLPTFRAGFPTGAPSYGLGVNDSQTLPLTATWNNSPFPNAPSYNSLTTPSTLHTPCMDSTCDGTAAHPYEIASISSTGGGGSSTCSTGNAPKLKLVGGSSLTTPVYYNINSFSQNSGNLCISGYVVLNIMSAFSIGGNGSSNGISADIPPEYLVINYAGTSGVTISGNGQLSALINAPNASVTLNGGGSGGYMVGAIQAKDINDQGGFPVHYDVQLSRAGGTMGVIVTTAYTRKKI